MSTGRVWIHNAQRPLNSNEEQDIKKRFQEFCAGWEAHGSALHSTFDILHHQVLVLKVDEDFEAASGCSIDNSVDVFRQIDAEYQLDLFNRMNLAFIIEGRIKLIRLSELNMAYQEGLLREDHLFLDHSVSNNEEMEQRWGIPFGQSWAFKKIKQIV